MLHRLLAICIVGFWLTMTSLLVVRETYPEYAGLNAVAVNYVAQLFFQHQQSSDLHVRAGSGEDIGYVYFQARPSAGPESRELEINGNIGVPMPNGSHQRLTWFGGFELDAHYNLQRFRLSLSGQDRGQHLDISVDRVAGTAKFTVRSGKDVVNRAGITLDQKGFESLVSLAGLDPTMLRQIKSAGTALPKFETSARVSSIQLGGETIATYLVIVKAADQIVLEAHVSQLGQVLEARMPLLGYKLALFKTVR